MLINSLCNDDDSDNNVMVVVTMVVMVMTMVMMVRLQMKYSQPWPSCTTSTILAINNKPSQCVKDLDSRWH